MKQIVLYTNLLKPQSFKKNITQFSPYFVGFIIGCILFSFSAITHSKEIFFYRYKDKNNTTVMNTYIPPEYITYGYEVLNKHGVVVKRVERALTKEEIAAKKALATQQLEINNKRKEQQNKKALLHKIFNSEADIVRRYQAKQSALESQIDDAYNLIRKLNQNKRQYIHQAAEVERQGLDVPTKILKNIKFFETRIENQYKYIENKNNEKLDLSSEFQHTLKKYRAE